MLVDRVTLNHTGATVLDLASRGFLSMAIADGPEWQLTATDAEPQDLLDYERTLLAGLLGRQEVIGVEHLTLWMVPSLE